MYQKGLPVISVSLPSRRERCHFTMKRLSDCVGVFLQQLQAEDRGIDRVAIYATGALTLSLSLRLSLTPSLSPSLPPHPLSLSPLSLSLSLSPPQPSLSLSL